jgi:putative endonuclease
LTVADASGWHLYMLRCNDGSVYTGITTDVERRIGEHRSGRRGARYLRARRPLELLYSAAFGNRSAASVAEYAVKALDKSQKELLVAGALSLRDVLDRRKRLQRDRANRASIR